ncbi:hypothetical protein T439DRAFT_376938 [Meredithblackwellia eburnea MCA 4105]
MAAPSAKSVVAASTTAAPVDMSAIELQKENIQPLASGRSATQLASLSTHSLSGLGSKNSAEHKRFQAQIDAIAAYDAAGNVWEDGRDGLSTDQVAALADDPLDIHIQYARFVLANYPAGNSAKSKLVPILEASTRKFVKDERYTNDPRYVRLWSLYAKHVDSPADCYTFLFTRGIGERIGLLYEEYAAALEAIGKRKQADEIYSIGIARLAVPLDRLKKKHAEFKARMLVAPPLPPSPPPATSNSRDARPILAGAGVGASLSLAGGKENGAKGFAVFQDGEGGTEQEKGKDWEDIGTAKSRKKENTIEAGPWKGETLPMGASSKPGAFKLEVFRDEDTPQPHSTSNPDSSSTETLNRSLRGPSEVDMLVKNPFKNYTDADLSIENGAVKALPSATPVQSSPSSSTSAGGGAPKKLIKKKKAPAPTPELNPDGTKKEAIGCDIMAVYPPGGGEFSFEEIKCMRNPQYEESARTWNGWQWLDAWTKETERKGQTSYKIDPSTGWPLLYHPETQEPLYDFIPPPPPSPQRSPSPELVELSPPPARQPQRNLLDTSASPIAGYSQPLSPEREVPVSFSPSSSPSRSFAAPNRPPSPTINTKNAQLVIDSYFQNTIKIDEDENDNEDDGDEEPDTEDEDDNQPAHWAHLPPSQVEISSQFTQSSSQASSVMAPFGLSQGPSDSMIASQFSVMSDVTEEDEMLGSTNSVPVSMAGMVYADDDGDENAPEARPFPMRLFQDVQPTVSANPTSNRTGFRPVTRVPLGMKTGTPLAAPSRVFRVMSDAVEEAEEVVPSSQPDLFEAEESFEAPTKEVDGPAPSSSDFGDGFAMGRRAKGMNAYASQIDNLTPITERTYEYTTAMTTTSLSTSQRSRRGSVFPPPEAVEEEDETESSSDEEYAGDQAFVGVASEGEEEDDDSDRSSFQRGGFSSEEEEEDEVPAHPILPQLQPPVPSLMASTSTADSSSEWRNSTRKDGHFDDELSIPDHQRLSVSSAGLDRSFEVSLNTSLPEGFTITGNQSGMTTNMVLADATGVSISSPSSTFPNPCNPLDASVLKRYLAASPDLLQLPGAHDHRGEKADKLASLQKVAKKREALAKKPKSKDRTEVIEAPWTLELVDEEFSVRRKLGEGAYGAVFQIMTSTASDPDVSFQSDVDEEIPLAIKVEQPPNLWEYRILQQLHSRLDARSKASVVSAHRFYAFEDQSFLFLDYSDQGTLLEIVNKANESGIAPQIGGVAQGVDEVLAMFFMIELMRTIEGFHRAGFIHGDLKIDNCLVRLEDAEGGNSAWANSYDRFGNAGWSAKGIKVIDFGRTVDLSMFPEDQKFVTDLETTPLDCLEMREGRTWTFEPDYFGLASIAYNLLFGKYIETSVGEDDKVVISSTLFKRYHQVEIWTRLFDLTLNPKLTRPDAKLPITDELAIIRSEMEDWLELNCNKNGKSLRSLVRKIEAHALARGR